MSSKLPPICLLLIAAVAWLVASATTAALADTRICRQLAAQLAGGRAGRFSVEKYDAAIERQRDAMDDTRGQARDAGCGYSVSGRNVRQCALLANALDRMTRNLASLQRDRGRSAQAGPSRKERSKVLAALEANGCGDDAAEPLAARVARRESDSGSATRRGLDGMLDEQEPAPMDRQPEAFPGKEDAVAQTFRTMCVRTCDGYFYPMSTASTVSDFDRDQKNCETSCPGTEMRVFYGPTDTDEPAAMISTVDGAPYSALPTAFRHQQTSIPRPASCGCNAAKAFEVIAGKAASGLPIASGGEIAPAPPEDSRPPADDSGSFVSITPTPRPVQTVHPETDSSRSTRFEKDDVVAGKSAVPKRAVRVVGPEFLPDPEAAIDLRAPAQPSVQ